MRRSSTPVMPLRARLDMQSPLGVVSQCGPVVNVTGSPSTSFSSWRTFGRFALVYLTEGGGLYEDQLGRSIPVKAGDLILIFPTLPHRYGPTSRDRIWREVYLVFEGPVFDLWLRDGLLDMARPVMHLEPVSVWQRRMVDVVDPMPPASAMEAVAEVCRLQHLLADMLAFASQGKRHDEDRNWIARARALLESGLDAHQAARQMHCSYAMFRKRFTLLGQVPPARYQAGCVINRACRMMHTTTLSDKQIARELGFCDEFHFSRRFTRIVGLSPRAYRKQLP